MSNENPREYISFAEVLPVDRPVSGVALQTGVVEDLNVVKRGFELVMRHCITTFELC